MGFVAIIDFDIAREIRKFNLKTEGKKKNTGTEAGTEAEDN